MDETQLAGLRTYYESLSDEGLLAEAGLGRDAYTSEAWTIISQEVDLRGLKHGHAHRNRSGARHEADVAERGKEPGPAERLAARIDALPPNIRPAAYGAAFILLFAMARGAWFIVPIAVVYVLATSADPGAAIMTGVDVILLAMCGGALSGLAYGFIGRHVKRAIRGGYYLTGVITITPYMLVLPYIIRLADDVPFWSRPSGEELAFAAVMWLIFGLVIGHSWFGPTREGRMRRPGNR